MIFSDFVRTDANHRKFSERRFSHINRSAEPEYFRIRELLESWAAHVPDPERFQFEQRIQSGDDRAFDSAFFELYIHELHLRTGHKIVHHPILCHTKKRPDFLATDHDARSAIFEATVATETTDEDRGNEARLNALYDAINDRVESPDYFVGVDVEGTANTPIPIASWSQQVQSWLDGLDYEDVVAIGQQGLFEYLPVLEFEHDGVIVVFRPIAKKQSARRKPGARALGVQGGQSCWVTSHIDIAKALRKKATRYGEMAVPFVIAVNCTGPWSDWEEIRDAIFGGEGLWPLANRALFGRVSAVLAVDHLLPWSVPRAEARLFHNPNATLPYRGALTALPQARLESGQVEELDGTHPRVWFGLTESWPEQ
jgi:hypothetical protein